MQKLESKSHLKSDDVDREIRGFRRMLAQMELQRGPDREQDPLGGEKKKKEEREERVLGPAGSRAQFCLFGTSATCACSAASSGSLCFALLCSPTRSSSSFHNPSSCLLLGIDFVPRPRYPQREAFAPTETDLMQRHGYPTSLDLPHRQ